ncbi:MAG: IPT/TIG domain-containing protein, partial [Actinomycetota bacterium]
TSGVTFKITPDGSCTVNVCGSSVTGLHTVKATRGALSTSVSLLVGGPTPVIASFAPTSGNVGTLVVITGTAFTGATDVRVNATSVPFTVDSDTQITATIVSGTVTGKISVVAPGGTVVSSATFKVTPQITGFSPASGPSGTTVVITGSGFTGATSVTFNSIAASFTFNSDGQITAVAPCCGASGKIRVITAGGTAVSATAFKVPPQLAGFSPSTGPVTTAVVITGSAFTGATSVTFGGIAATFTVDSDNQITAIVPAGAVTGKIKVTTGGGSVTSATSFTVT